MSRQRQGGSDVKDAIPTPFLTTLSLAGAASLVRMPPAPAAEGALETTSVRFSKSPAHLRRSPIRRRGAAARRGLYRYPLCRNAITGAAAPRRSGAARSISPLNYAIAPIQAIDAGEPITVLAGVHVGCFELFAKEAIRGIADLKGKTVGVRAWARARARVRLMAAQVGLDPAKDIHWVTDRRSTPLELFAEGKIDAFLGFPPEPQELRARQGRPRDRQHGRGPPLVAVFLLHAVGNREYVRKYPVATKRVLRAILKATDLCATDPTRVAQSVVDRGFTVRYDYALQTLSESLTTDGGSTMPRTRYGSTRCACTRPA